MSTLTPAEKPKTDTITNISFYVLIVGVIVGLVMAVGYVIYSYFE